MASDTPPRPSGNNSRPKPWEMSRASSAPGPFKPPSSGTTSQVVEASGNARPGEVTTIDRSASSGTGVVRAVPARPWDMNYGNSYGRYNSGVAYNPGYGTGMYGNYGGSYGDTYNSGLYPYRRGYGGVYGGAGLYGSGTYNNLGVPVGGYGLNDPFNDRDPNGPSPPGFWMSFLHTMQGVVTFFSRIAMLIDQNTQAFHMLMSALLQIFDRSGLLYGELARFVLRLLGFRTKMKNSGKQIGGGSLQGPNYDHIDGVKATGSTWDGVWQETGGN